MSGKYCKSRIQNQNYNFWDSKIMKCKKIGECILRRFSWFRVLGAGPPTCRPAGSRRPAGWSSAAAWPARCWGPGPGRSAPGSSPPGSPGARWAGSSGAARPIFCGYPGTLTQYTLLQTSNRWYYVNLSEWLCDPLMKRNRFQRFLFLAFPCQFLFSVCAAVIGELSAIQRHGRVGPSVATPDTRH